MGVGVGSARRTLQAEHASLFVGCVRTGRRNCVRCAHGLAPCVPYTPATPLYLQCICQRGRRSHVILQNGSSTGRRCEWVGSCPWAATSSVGVGSARAPSSRSARAATALAARSMRRSAATRGSEDALLSFYINPCFFIRASCFTGPGLCTHASGPGHPQAWAGRSGEA